MSQKKIIYKNNIFTRFANVSNIYLVFYGFVKGVRAENPNISIKKIYIKFTSIYEIDDDLDNYHFQCAYNRINKMMIELKREIK